MVLCCGMLHLLPFVIPPLHGVNKTSGGLTNGMKTNESYLCSHDGGDGGGVMLWNAASASPPYYHSSHYGVNETSG